MTNYFKVYLTSKNGRQCVVAKNKAGVINVLNNAIKEHYLSYLIVKCIKGTDIPIARGNLYKECKVLYRVQKGRIVIQLLEIYVAIYFSLDPKLI